MPKPPTTWILKLNTMKARIYHYIMLSKQMKFCFINNVTIRVFVTKMLIKICYLINISTPLEWTCFVLISLITKTTFRWKRSHLSQAFFKICKAIQTPNISNFPLRTKVMARAVEKKICSGKLGKIHRETSGASVFLWIMRIF